MLVTTCVCVALYAEAPNHTFGAKDHCSHTSIPSGCGRHAAYENDEVYRRKNAHICCVHDYLCMCDYVCMYIQEKEWACSYVRMYVRPCMQYISHVAWHHITSHHITSHHISSHHVALHCITCVFVCFWAGGAVLHLYPTHINARILETFDVTCICIPVCVYVCSLNVNVNVSANVNVKQCNVNVNINVNIMHAWMYVY